MAADVGAGRPAWQLTLIGGAIAQAVVGMMLLSLDRSGIRAEVARDIVIVGGLGIAVAIVVAVLAPSAASDSASSKVVRRLLIAVIALMAFVSLAGAMSLAVTPWVAVPAGVMIIGLILLFRGSGAGEGTGR